MKKSEVKKIHLQIKVWETDYRGKQLKKSEIPQHIEKMLGDVFNAYFQNTGSRVVVEFPGHVFAERPKGDGYED